MFCFIQAFKCFDFYQLVKKTIFFNSQKKILQDQVFLKLDRVGPVERNSRNLSALKMSEDMDIGEKIKAFITFNRYHTIIKGNLAANTSLNKV